MTKFRDCRCLGSVFGRAHLLQPLKLFADTDIGSNKFESFRLFSYCGSDVLLDEH